MPDSNSNLIKIKQIEPGLTNFIEQVASGQINDTIYQYSLTGYHGPNVLYKTGGAQTILGSTTFSLPLNIPYSGNDTQSVSKLFVNDKILPLTTGLAGIDTRVVHITGDQSINGIKTFESVVTNQGITGNSITFTIADFATSTKVPNVNLNSSPDLRSALNLNFFYNQGIIFSTGTQTILANKEFTYSPLLTNIATGSSQAVRFSQLIDSGAWLQQQIDGLANASGSAISGFGGVISWNGKSGTLYGIGRGTVTVTQQGNVTFISGHTPVLSGSGVYLIQGEQGITGISGAAGASGAWRPRGTFSSNTLYSGKDAVGYVGSTYGFSGVSSSGFLAPTGAGWYVIAASGNKGYRTYAANISQTGLIDPTVNTVYQNDFTGALVWKRGAVGTYSGVLANTFSFTKVPVLVGLCNVINPLLTYEIRNYDGNFVRLLTYNNGVLSDGILDNFIEIRQYN